MSEGLRKLAAGEQAYESVRQSCLSPSGPTDEDEAKLRDALHTLRSATNWLEGTTDFERAHEVLDRAGTLAREVFPEGCLFPYKDGTYYVECPVALAHNRSGMSIGFVARAVECSICGQDPEDCIHITGRMYDGERCVRTITDLDLLEVSVVSRPAQPDARIMSMPIDMKELREELGEDFTPGIPLTCDRCLSPCDGVVYPFEHMDWQAG